MKEGQIKQLYTSPEAEMTETQLPTVICVSNPNGTDSYSRENW